MCEFCEIEDWQKENPAPLTPDPYWNVRFLDVVQAGSASPQPGALPQKIHYERRYVDVSLIAPSRFVAERLAWDLLQKKIGRVPFKDDFVLMGASEVKPKMAQGDEWAPWDKHTIRARTGSGPCWHCGKETVWIEINFESWLCSPECNAAKWKEYEEAARHAPQSHA